MEINRLWSVVTNVIAISKLKKKSLTSFRLRLNSPVEFGLMTKIYGALTQNGIKYMVLSVIPL